MVDLGLVVLLALHLLGMNVASGGPLLCLLLSRRGHPQQDAARNLAARLALWCNGLLLAAIVVGLAAGALRWAAGDSSFVQVLPLFGKKVLWGTLEILCSLLWMGGYWLWLVKRPPQTLVARVVHGSLPVLSATNLLYHFPPLLTVMSQTAAGAIRVAEPVDAAAFRALIFTPNVLAQTLHFWWASLAVAGVFLFWLVKDAEAPHAVWRLGGRVAFGATLLQIPTGLWLLVVTPANHQSMLMGSAVVPTCCFLGSLIATFFLLQQLGTLALGDATWAAVRWASGLMTITVVLMTAALHFLRA